MNDIAIRVDGLSKTFRIGQKPKYKSLRDAMTRAVGAPLRRLRGGAGGRGDVPTFYALRDICFDVKRGEVLGIIGRNGAGKSTLLKILCRITEPSAGKAWVYGRVGSLLEVGTGFHPELTGRENIFLNGSILGMKGAEIKGKFDQIVDFSGVEQFLDTPVKHFSSGMYMRLAFAVAAHLEPEILVVDEVLAVGDADFQKKCLGKMGEVARGGRTVLFVSHNMNAVERLCASVLYLDKGRVYERSTDVRGTISRYMHGTSDGDSSTTWRREGTAYANRWFVPTRFAVVNADSQPLGIPTRNDAEMFIEIDGIINQPDPTLQIGYNITSEDGTLLFASYTTDPPESFWPRMPVGPVRVRSRIPSHFLNEGDFRLELCIAMRGSQWICEPSVNAPSIRLSIQGGLSDSPYYDKRRDGVLAPIFPWELMPSDGSRPKVGASTVLSSIGP
jgi:lipopolysaccharide transport system ATP-binding protein